MGNIFTRKTKSTFELLDNLDKSINDADEYQKTTQLSQKRYVGYLMIFSSLIYLTAVFVGYFYYYPRNFHDVALRLLPLSLFPFVIYGLKIAGCWWFVLRLEANQQNLDRMKRKRREILDQVKDKEVYNVAKEILEKFDPQLQLERLQRERKTEEEREKEMNALLRHRRRRSIHNPGEGGDLNEQKIDDNPQRQNPQSSATYKLPRPILPRERNALDKCVDYLLGDGPNNRYALICIHCLSHNGMALSDDFEYVAYRCAYCGGFNPAKKQRPKSPPSTNSSGRSEPPSVAESTTCGSATANSGLFTTESKTLHKSVVAGRSGSPSKKPLEGAAHPFEAIASPNVADAATDRSEPIDYFVANNVVPKSDTLESFGIEEKNNGGNTDSSDDHST